MSPESTDTAVLAANEAFYQALEGGELGVMEAVWAHDGDVVCAHPGRPPLRGWADVRRSWEAIFAGGGNPQVILTDATVGRRGAVAWVTATENLLTGQHTSATTALNIFNYAIPDGAAGGVGARWLLVAHHAGPIVAG